MILSIHIPKTAGTSFKESLQDVLGDRLFLDYDSDKALSWLWKHKLRRWRTRFSARCNRAKLVRDFDVIHGHYMAEKYDFLPNRKYAAFFRNPVYQAVSHYEFVARNKNPDIASYRKICVQSVSLRDYLQLPNQSCAYRIYLSGRDPRTFDFVGMTEHYEESLALFHKIFGFQLTMRESNKNEDSKYEKLIEEAGGHRVLEEMLAENMHYHGLASQRFDELRRKFL